MTNGEIFREVALGVGRRIVAAARPDGDGLTWLVLAPDRANPDSRQATPEPAGGMLYTGTSGIALFLAELHAVAADDAFAATAMGAVRHALTSGEALAPSSFGFHSGRVGIAYAAARVGELLGEPSLSRQAEALLREMRGHEGEDRGLDVIGGAAGAIPALLAMPAAVDATLRMETAVALGDRMAAAASREPVGWSWGTMGNSAVRNLCGYAHGAAGAGHAFLELFHATGEGRFLYGAEQAFLYERPWLSAEEGNWPDLRHMELGEYLLYGRRDALRDRLRAGDPLAPYAPRYMSAWCHGAPGIAWSRLRAYALLGDDVYLAEARAALATTEASLADARYNFSLCHGRCGNAESLLYAADVLGDPSLRARVEALAVEGWEACEGAGRPWLCGTLGGAPDPSLMLGEAGIGHFYLRLHAPSVPSVLFPTATAEASPSLPAADIGWRLARDHAVDEWFGRTLVAMGEMGLASPLHAGGRAGAPLRDAVEDAHDALSAAVAAEGDEERRALLEDAFAVERESFALAASAGDFTTEFMDALARPDDGEVRWEDDAFVLSPRARLVHVRHGWDAWLRARAAGEGGDAPEADDAFHLLQAAGTRVGSRRVSPFAAAVLEALGEPTTLDEVVDHVSAAVSGDGAPDRGWLRDRVREQLRQAYRAGMVERETAPAAV